MAALRADLTAFFPRMNATTASTPPTSTRDDAKVMGLVGLAHCISHFSQLLLPPLFFLLKDAFQVGFAELGFVLTVFFVVSCGVQALSGFVVDRFGPRPVLFGGLALLAAGAFGYAASTSYAMLVAFAVVAGIGNGVFHPVDYTLLNRKIHSTRLGHAFAVHGITGSLGWALAPAMMATIALAFSWRVALASAGVLIVAVIVALWFGRSHLGIDMTSAVTGKPHPAKLAAPGDGSFGFLAIPAVWMCFGFFFLYAVVISVIQTFAPEAARQLHGVPLAWAAMCLTFYMVASAGGMVVGGFLATDPARSEKVVGAGFSVAAAIALVVGFAPIPALAVPALFALMGVASGIAGPSRDLIVKRAAPPNATGRVYGVVYSGLDIGQAVAPLVFGPLMDMHRTSDVWLGIAIVQAILIMTAFNVHRVRRTALTPASA